MRKKDKIIDDIVKEIQPVDTEIAEMEKFLYGLFNFAPEDFFKKYCLVSVFDRESMHSVMGGFGQSDMYFESREAIIAVYLQEKLILYHRKTTTNTEVE